MKLKYYLMGLGTGMILTTILLSFGTKQDSTVTSNDTSAQEVEEQPESSGVTIDYDSIMNSISEENEDTHSQEGEDEQEQEEKSDNEKDSTNEPQTSDSSESDSTTETDSSDTALRDFTITNGMTASQIADLLEAAGVIDNASKFTDYVKDNKYSTKLWYGTYELPANCTYDQVIETLVRDNK